MPNFKDFLANVHENVHDLRAKKQFTEPKIYTGGVDVSKWKQLSKEDQAKALKKAWYIYYSFRDPATDRLKRQPNIKAGANYYTNKKERLEVLKVLKSDLLNILQNGYNPYTNSKKTIEPLTVQEAIKEGLRLKRGDMSAVSYKDFKSRINKFEQYLISHGFKNRYITSVDKKTVVNYLNSVQEKTSNRNRNNVRVTIASVFSKLENNEIITDNFLPRIEVLKSIPQRNKTYSEDLVNDIFEYLEVNNPQLLLFIKFVSYNFLRPIEVCRLKIGDVNIEKKSLRVFVKQGKFKEKIIPDILLNDLLPDLSSFDKEAYLFPTSGGSDLADNRRDYFTKQFKRVKDHFKLGADYGIYSFRHTFITKLYRSFRKTQTPFEVKSKLMLITGHATMSALEKYLRDLDVELPEDYSDNL